MRKFLLTKVLPTLLFFFLAAYTFKRYAQIDPSVYDVDFKPYRAPEYDSILNQLDRQFINAQQQNLFPGAAVVIVKDNHILFRKCYGVKKYGSKDSVDLHTVFRLGSVSKGFASILTGVLVQKKILNWDDTVKHILPDFELQNKDYENSLTIRHVLSHTTGLPMHAYSVLLDDNVPYKEIKPLLCSIPSIGPPGMYYSYQNVAYSLIADVMQAKTGKDYSTLLKKELFKPLGMENSSSDYKTISKSKNTAFPHIKIRNGKWHTEKHNKRYYDVGPAAGVNASISDLTEWLKAMLTYKTNTVDTSTLNTVFKPHIRSLIKWKYKNRWKKLDKVYYGLGWRIFDYGKDTVVFHSGYVRGYKAEIALLPSENLGIAVIFNGASSFCSSPAPFFINSYLDLKASK